jgi:RNA polymerase sigma-70 factor (ECF subfamily)
MFQTTRWSLFLAGRDDPGASRAAIEHLCLAYRRPVLSYVRRLGHPREEAEDLTQAFFVSLIERRLDGRADPLRGRFRTLLLTALKRYLRNTGAARGAEKRGGGRPLESMDGIDMAGVGADEPDQVFDRQWAVTVLERAMAALEAEARHAGKAVLFEALREFLIESPNADDYARLAAAHGMRANTLAVAVHRLRQKLRDKVRDELAETVSSDAELDAEMDVLRDALGGAGRRTAAGAMSPPAPPGEQR